jgi:putative FmdB family regulatory protein
MPFPDGHESATMPIYEYEHTEQPCAWGKVFEIRQSIQDAALHRCPNCRAPVRKLISLTNISTPKTNAELRDLGFTKLVRRDDGAYENVTARPGESKVMLRDKPETQPHLGKIIPD